MKKLFYVAVIIAMLCGTTSYAAEKPWSVHLYPFGGYWLGGDWMKGEEFLGSGTLYGGRLGLALGEHFEIEGGYEFCQNEFQKGEIFSKDADVDITMWYGDFLINFLKSQKFNPYFLVGYGKSDFDSEVTESDPDMMMWGLGLKYYPIDFVGLRMEARQAIYKDSPDNILVTAGLDFRFLGKWTKKQEEAPRVSDGDGDGVTDNNDKCPATSYGAKVDGDGCPLDEDGDKVFDGLDDCPGTPSGAAVDAKGCTADSDGDGVVDGVDQCPRTPKGATVDANGCPADSDGDGVSDGLDRCPGTPAGAKVDQNGCPLDGDGDGVADGIDVCPTTPAGMKVDARGCTADQDGDTVPDSADKCPNTPINTPVDRTGCPEAAAVGDSDGDTVLDDKDKCPKTAPGVQVDETGCQTITDSLVLEGITFKTGKSTVDPKSYPALKNAVEILKSHPDMKVEVQGYTDASGKKATNVKLSNARAKAVYDYLVKAGIAKTRLSYKGYGPDNPRAPNTTPEGRAKNRRIEFKIVQ